MRYKWDEEFEITWKVDDYNIKFFFSFLWDRRGVLGNEDAQDTFWLLMEEVTQCEWVLGFRMFSKAGSEIRMWVCLEDDPKKHCQGRRKVREGSRKSIKAPSWPHLGHMGLSPTGEFWKQHRRHLGVFPPEGQGSLAFNLQVPLSPGLTPTHLQSAPDLGWEDCHGQRWD